MSMSSMSAAAAGAMYRIPAMMSSVWSFGFTGVRVWGYFGVRGETAAPKTPSPSAEAVRV